MHLINNINPVPPFCGRILNLFPNFSDIFHTIVGSRINLNYVHRTAGYNALAALTLSAWASVNRMFTVDCLCKNLGNGSFSGSPCSAEQIGMTNALPGYLIFQGLYNMILSLNVRKSCRPPLAVQRSI